MDVVKILQAIEELIYEFVIWIIFIPKTLVQVVLHPSWIHPYVAEEWHKSPKERYDAYLSPVIFWLIITVIPYVVFLDRILTSALPYEKAYRGLLLENRIATSTVILLGLPAFITYVLQKLKREPIQRRYLQRLFHIQCLCCAPYQLFSIPFDFAIPMWDYTLRVANYVFIVWFFIAEAIIFKQELDVSYLKAFFLSFVSLVVLHILAFVILAIIVFGSVATLINP